MNVHIQKLVPEQAYDAYNCQPDTPELIEFKKASANFLAEKIRTENWIAFALYKESIPIGKAILNPTSCGMTGIEGDGIYFFHCLNLQSGFRGEGYGRKFLTSILKEMQKMDVKAVAVTCFAEYWMSFKFFKHMGFEK